MADKKEPWVKLKEGKFVPFENIDAEIKKLFVYYLYLAPNIDSSHSIKKDFSGLSEKVIENFFYDFDVVFRKEFGKNDIKSGFLEKESIKLEKIIFMRKRAKSKSNPNEELKLNCFLRHLRNSIAHGLTYRWKKQSYWYLFEDITGKNNISARILCTRKDLEKWKNILMNNFSN